MLGGGDMHFVKLYNVLSIVKVLYFLIFVLILGVQNKLSRVFPE